MKKVFLILLCYIVLFSTVSCDDIHEKEDFDTNTFVSEITESGTTESTTLCVHRFGEWSVSKEATECEDGEQKRTCFECEYSETKPIHAKGTDGLLFTLSKDGTSYSVSAGTATEGDVVIPAYHNGLPVTSIGYIGFANDENAAENFEVGNYAFLKCTNLKSVVIPATVTVIGDGAFMMCEALNRIVIPESVKEIGEYAFALTEEEFPLNYYHSDITTAIPNSQVILLLHPIQSFFSWGVEIYYFDGNGNEVLIETVLLDNSSLAPFSNGDFEIINNHDNTFSVHAGTRENDGWTIDKTFDIPQCVSVFVPKAEDTVTVFYGGNDGEEWDAIDIAKGNIRLTKDNITVKKCVIYYYSETEPTEANKYWHYVDGVPTVW
jgi:hypothetical protein